MATGPEFFLRTHLDQAAWRLREVVSRWRQDLATCVAEAAPAGPRAAPELRITGDQAALAVAGDAGDVPLPLAEPSGAALRAVWQRRSDGRARPLVLVFGPDELLLTRVTLPRAAAVNLREVLGFEMDRLTPFTAQDVYFDFRRVNHRSGRVPEAGVVLELALIRRATVDRWVQLAASAGLAVSGVQGSGLWEDADLLPPGHRRRVGRPRVTWQYALVGMLGLLLAAVLLTPLWQAAQEVAYLEAQIEAVEQRAEVVLKQQNALQVRQQLGAFLDQAAREQVYTVEILRELTQRLPDNTWLEQLQLTGDRVELRGQSSQASALIKILEASALFESVAFQSSVVGVSDGRLERFHIGMRLVDGGVL